MEQHGRDLRSKTARVAPLATARRSDCERAAFSTAGWHTPCCLLRETGPGWPDAQSSGSRTEGPQMLQQLTDQDAIFLYGETAETPAHVGGLSLVGLGIGAHPLALYAIADRLAQPEGQWRPFQRDGWKALAYGDALT
jgi:hypothetical protein